MTVKVETFRQWQFHAHPDCNYFQDYGPFTVDGIEYYGFRNNTVGCTRLLFDLLDELTLMEPGVGVHRSNLEREGPFMAYAEDWIRKADEDEDSQPRDLQQ